MLLKHLALLTAKENNIVMSEIAPMNANPEEPSETSTNMNVSAVILDQSRTAIQSEPKNSLIPGDPKQTIESLVKLIVGAIGLAYGTGYLVVLTFLNGYGINEPGGDALKLHYIYVGGLALTFPILMALALHGLFSGSHKIPAEAHASSLSHFFSRLIAPSENMPTPLIIMLLSLLMVFYCIVAFSRPGSFSIEQPLINLLYVPLLLTLFLRLIVGERILWSRRLTIVRWVLAASTVVFSVFILRAIDFRGLWSGRVYNYVVLQILFFFFVYRFTKWSPLGSDPGQRMSRLVVRTMILCPLFLLCVFSFAHTVFNHIPAEKGGGDFSETADSKVCFYDAYRTSIPVSLLAEPNNQPLCTVPLKVIEQGTSDVFVARTSDRGSFSPEEAPDPAALWRSDKYHPVVFDLNRAEISSIVILNSTGVQLSSERAPSSSSSTCGSNGISIKSAPKRVTIKQ